MKDKLYKLLQNPFSIVVVIIVATLLSLPDRNFGYFFGLGIALFLVWRSKWDWSIVGFAKKISRKTILKSIWLTIQLFVGLSIVDPIWRGWCLVF